MSDTPETDALLAEIFDRDGSLGPHNAPEKLIAKIRKLERERDEARKHNWNNMVCIHHTDMERAAAVGHCPICASNTKERDQWRACAERLAAVCKSSAGTGMHWKDAEEALAEFERLKKGETEK